MKGIVRSSKFRHVFGKTVRKEDQYENLMPGTAGPDSNLCDVNKKYFALPWRGGGGPFVVWSLNKPGRLPQVCEASSVIAVLRAANASWRHACHTCHLPTYMERMRHTHCLPRSLPSLAAATLTRHHYARTCLS